MSPTVGLPFEVAFKVPVEAVFPVDKELVFEAKDKEDAAGETALLPETMLFIPPRIELE